MLRVERGVGKTDVVEDVVHLILRDGGTNGLLDQIAEAGRFLDAGSGLGADVEDEGAIVAVGKKVLTQQRDEQHADEAGEQEERDEHLASFNELSEERLVGGANGFEAAFEAALEAGKDIL